MPENKAETNLPPMPTLRRWWLAIRPRTLPAAGSPVLIGFAIAWSVGQFRWLPALVILACALLLQLGDTVGCVRRTHQFSGASKSGRTLLTYKLEVGRPVLTDFYRWWFGGGLDTVLNVPSVFQNFGSR